MSENNDGAFAGSVNIRPSDGALSVVVTVGGVTVDRLIPADECPGAQKFSFVATAKLGGAQVERVSLRAEGVRGRRGPDGKYQSTSWSRVWQIWPAQVEETDVPAVRVEVEGYLRRLMRGEEGRS